MDEPKVTAGRDQLGAFAPQFASLNDDVLFGQAFYVGWPKAWAVFRLAKEIWS